MLQSLWPFHNLQEPFFFFLNRGPRTVIDQEFGAVMANANITLCILDEQQEGKYRNAQHIRLHKDMQVGNNP